MANATPIVSLPSVIAHRGASGTRPENTLASLRHAHALGASWVEIDVKLTKDGVPVLFHDKDLKRTAGVEGEVKDFTFAELRALEAGRWFDAAYAGEKIPSFEEVITLALELGLQMNVELKPNEGEAAKTAEASIDLLNWLWPQDRPRPLFSSFERVCLETVRDLAPEYPRGLLIHEDLSDWQAEAERLVCATIHPWHETLTPELVRSMKNAGYGLATYTVNDPARAKVLADMGVDSIITDFPDRIAAAL